jgi:signal transduction histidine kinase
LHAFEQAVRGATLYSTIEGNDGPARILSFPMIDRGELVAVAQIPHPLADTYRALNGLARTLLTLIPVALLIAAVGGAFLTDRALRPVRQISETAGRIGSKDLSERLAVAGNDEFSELSSTFNGMLARLEESFQRMEGILEQQRRFTGDASHELRTPLTIIKANTTLVLRGERPSADYIRSLKSIDRAADTMGGIVQDLLLLARSDGGQLGQNSEITPVSELIARATEVVRSSQAPSTSLGTAPPVRVDVADASLSVIGNPDELTRMFSNIVENAARHTPPDGQILIHAIGQDGHVQVKVEDTGEGIPPEHLPHVCERFYRADDARARDRGGTGLGLAICKSIAEAHKGSLEIRSAPGEGTTVLIRLPRFLVEDTEL